MLYSTNVNNILSVEITQDGTGFVLRAYYTRNSYTVTFDSNIGADPVNVPELTLLQTEVSVKYGQTYNWLFNETDYSATRSGYTFRGWAFTSTISFDSELITKTTIASASNVTVYAIWEANAYKVTYDVNGGNEATLENQIVYFAENPFVDSPSKISTWSPASQESFQVASMVTLVDASA